MGRIIIPIKVNGKRNDEIVKKKKIRVAAYARVSTLEEEQESSFESQIEYYRSFITSHDDYELVDIYSDHGISGLHTSNRPGFMKMMEDVNNDLIDVIYTKSISRFSRNYIECKAAIDMIKEHHAVIYFEQEGLSSDTPQFDFVFNLMSMIAQEESNSKSQNINWALDKYNEEGKPKRICPYGYKKSLSDNSKWEIEPEEAKRVQYIFSLVDKGYSNNKILNLINNYERRYGSTRSWSISSIKRIINNEAYIGNILTNKYYRINYLIKKNKKNDGDKRRYLLEDHHTPLISKESFYKINNEVSL